MKNSRILIMISTAILLSGTVFAQGTLHADDNPAVQDAIPTFSQQTIKFGSYGEDVYELQGRLKHLGFYYGKIDSVFGSKTLGAVKWFQSEFGMKVDGIVGPKVKLKLYNATKDFKPTEPKLHEGEAAMPVPEPEGMQGMQAAGETTTWPLRIRWVYLKMTLRSWPTRFMGKPGANHSKGRLPLQPLF